VNIILVSEKLPKARTITLGWLHLAGAAVLMLTLVLTLAGALNYGILRFAAELNIPYVRDMLVSIHQRQQEKNQSYLQDNLNAMAVRLGQMQAQLLRLDTLGERLAKLAGARRRDFVGAQPESFPRGFYPAGRPADTATGRPWRQAGPAGVDVYIGKRQEKTDPDQASG